MKNPWTTIPGVLLLVSAAATFAHTLMTGGDLNAAWGAVIAAAGGVGLLKAQQGPL